MVHIDTARYCNTDIEVDIDDLEAEVSAGDYTGEEIRKTRCFQCPGCELELIPKAIDPQATERPDRQINHPSPHFAIKIPNSTHGDNCDIDAYLKFANTKVSNRVYPSQGGFPFGYPSKLVLTTATQIFSTPDNTNLAAKGQQLNLPRQDFSQRVRDKHKTVKTLKLLVKHFISFPEDEYRKLSLTVPGVGLSTYRDVFQRLRWCPGYEYKAVRIYFAELIWKHTQIEANRIYLPTVEGDWADSPPTRSLYLELDMSKWAEKHKELTRQRVESCIANSKSPEKQKAWIFFLGNQVEGHELKLQLYRNDYRLIYCMNDQEDSLKNHPKTWIAEKVFTVESTEQSIVTTSILQPQLQPEDESEPASTDDSGPSTSVAKKEELIPSPQLSSPQAFTDAQLIGDDAQSKVPESQAARPDGKYRYEPGSIPPDRTQNKPGSSPKKQPLEKQETRIGKILVRIFEFPPVKLVSNFIGKVSTWVYNFLK
jgi:hypothetical protein